MKAFTPIMGFRDEQGRSGLDCAEGAVTVDEASAVFTSRVGTETMDEFIIKAHERKDIETITQRDGELVVRNFTAGMAFGSTVGKIRRSMNAEAFGGGLMHRFLIAHELQMRPIDASDVDPLLMASLAQEALEIRHRAPDEMGIAPDAKRKLKMIAAIGQDKALKNEEMSGFFNRQYAISAQLAITIALSEHRTRIEYKDIDEAYSLTNALVVPLVELVRELRFGTQQQVLFQLAEVVYHLGEEGMDFTDFKQSIPATNSRSLKDAIQFLKELNLIWVGQDSRGKRVYKDGVVGRAQGYRDLPEDLPKNTGKDKGKNEVEEFEH